MKILKKISLACFIILLLCAGIARTPFVQRGIISHFLKQQFNEVYLEKISIGTSSARIKKLSLSTQTFDIKLDNANISWSFHDLIFAKTLTINNIDLNGLIVSYHTVQEQQEINNISLAKQLNQSPGAHIDTAEQQLRTIGKILSQCIDPRISPKITIKKINLDGILDINEILVADVRIDCGAIAPLTTTTAKIDADISIENKQPITATFDGTVQFSQTENGTIPNILIQTQCDLLDNHATLQKSLTGTVSFANTTDNKSFDITIDGADDDRSLLSLAINFDRTTNVLTTKCSHNFDIDTFNKLFPSQELPRIETSCVIDGEINMKSLEGVAKATIDATMSKNIINKFLPGVCSDIKFSSDIACLMSDRNIRLQSIEGTVNSSDDSIKILFFSQSPIIIWNELQGLSLAKNIKNSNTPLFGIEIENINPASIFQTSSVIDTDISWTFNIASKNNTWYINTSEDNLFVARNLSLKINNRKYLYDTKFSCRPQFVLGNNASLTIDNMQLNDYNDGTIIDGAVTVDTNIKNESCHINGYIVSDLNKLAHIPYCSCEKDILSGIFSAQFDYKQTGNDITAATDIRLKSLMTGTSQHPISGTLAANYTKSDGKHTISIPINVEGRHITSFSIDGTIQENIDNSTTPYDTTATIQGECLSITDITEITHAIVKLSKGNKHHNASKFSINNDVLNHRDDQQNSISSPFNHDGKISTKLDKIFVSDSMPLNNFDAFVTLDHDEITLKLLNFTISDSTVNAFGTIKSIPNKKSYIKEYDMSFSATAECNDIAQFLSTVMPSKMPAMTGSATGKFAISSPQTTLNNIINNMTGDILISCQNGTILPFNLMSAKTTAIMDTVGIASQMIFGDKLFGSQNTKASNIFQLKQMLQHIDYDDINVHIKRDDKGNFVIKECDIIGPNIHAYAIGSVQYLKHKPIDNFPLSITINCDVAGALGQAMDNLGLITDKPRHSKYMQGPQCTIKGTVGHPDYSSCMQMLNNLF